MVAGVRVSCELGCLCSWCWLYHNRCVWGLWKAKTKGLAHRGTNTALYVLVSTSHTSLQPSDNTILHSSRSMILIPWFSVCTQQHSPQLYVWKVYYISFFLQKQLILTHHSAVPIKNVITAYTRLYSILNEWFNPTETASQTVLGLQG